MGIAADERLAQMSLAQGVLIGCAQILAARRFRHSFCDTWRCWSTRCEMGIINYINCQGPAA